MTPKEMRSALKSMPEDEYHIFRAVLDERHEGRLGDVEHFISNPQFERILCAHLGLKTEDEKLVEASVSSAEAAKASARLALLSMIIALVSVIVSVITI